MLNTKHKAKLGLFNSAFMLVLALLLIQMALGITNVLAHLPLVIAVAHHAVAALLMLSLITLNHALRPRP